MKLKSWSTIAFSHVLELVILSDKYNNVYETENKMKDVAKLCENVSNVFQSRSADVIHFKHIISRNRMESIMLSSVHKLQNGLHFSMCNL